MARLCVGDRIFHLQFPLGDEQTGSCVVLGVINELEGPTLDGTVVKLRRVRDGRAFTCYHPTHRYSEDEGARLLLAGVRHGNDMHALFGNDRENYPYLEKGEKRGKREQRRSRKNVESV